MTTVGIKDVARAAGVSPATVSRVLAGKAVDPTLKARVEAAVEATGYRPNLAARRLRSQHTNTIGLIVADMRNPFFTEVGRAVEEVAYARGYRVILCNTNEDPQREDLYLRLMQEERVTGVIIAPTRRTAERIAHEEFDFPVVLIDRSHPGQIHDAVVLDNVAAASALVHHLQQAGYRRIAGLFGSASMTGVERRAGYIEAMESLGLTPKAQYVDHRPGAVVEAVRGLLDAAEPPEALLASNGLMLMEMVRGLNAAGVRSPDDIALAGFDNEAWMELVGGGLTVIEQPTEAIGSRAMSLILERVEASAAPPQKVVLGGRMIVRGSTFGPRVAALA